MTQISGAMERRRWAVTLIAAASLAAPGSAVADFTAPQTVLAGAGGFPSVALAPDGRAAVVATPQATNGLLLTVKGPGAAAPFGPAEPLTPVAVGGARVAIAPQGDVVAAWVPFGGGMQAVRRSASGVLGAVQTLVATGGRSPSPPSIATDPAGNTVIAFNEIGSGGGRVVSAWAAPGEPFGPLREVHPERFDSGAPKVAVTGTGQALVTYTASLSDRAEDARPVWVATVPMAGAPGTPRRLPTADDGGAPIALAPAITAHGGQALVSWLRLERGGAVPGPSGVQVAAMGADGTPGAVRSLGQDMFVVGPAVAVGPGRALAGWVAGGGTALAATGATPAALGGATTVPSSLRSGQTMSAGVDAVGNGVLLFQDEISGPLVGGGGRTDLRWAAVPAGRTTPCAARTLDSGDVGGAPAVVMDAAGGGLAVWARPGGVAASRWVAAGTGCASVPATAPVGAGMLTLSSPRATVRVARRPRVRLRLRCATGPGCTGPATLTSGSRTLAKGRLKVAATRTGTLTLKPPTTAATRRLRRAGTVKAKLTIRLARVGAASAKVVLYVRLRIRK